jgi:cobalt-precorrin-5B (C1)-methyltransferase
MGPKLRTGFTTGTAAAAAAKGALLSLFKGRRPGKVPVLLLTGDSMVIPIHSGRIHDAREASCTVIKDAGDDPDITHGAEIGARVTLLEKNESDPVGIFGGEGVGQITKPGLEMPPGEPAINPGPRKMITESVKSVLKDLDKDNAVRVEIFVPEGRRLSEKTLNTRLGIIGGISILGTTGLVKPLSHEAYIATVQSAMSVARAQGVEKIVLTTGRRSERFSQALWPGLPIESFVQIGDFFKQSLEIASAKGFESIRIAVFFGKAIKMAQGVAHTHAGSSTLTLKQLAEWTKKITDDSLFAETISDANTAREAFFLLVDRYPGVIAHVGQRIVRAARSFISTGAGIRAVIYDYNGRVSYDSGQTDETRPVVEETSE